MIDSLGSVKVDFPISSIVHSSNISKKENLLHEEVVKNDVYRIPEYVPIPIVLENWNEIVKIANRTEGNHDNSIPYNQDLLDFRIGYDSVSDIDGRTESSSFLRLDSEPNIELNEVALNADRCTANETVSVNK